MAAFPQRREGHTAVRLTLDPAAGHMPRPRSCFICVNVQFNSDRYGVATVCGISEEVIDSEKLAATDCEAYEEDDD